MAKVIAHSGWLAVVYLLLWVVLYSLYLSGYRIRIHLRVQILTISVSNFTFDTCYVKIGRSVKVIAGESRFVLNSLESKEDKTGNICLPICPPFSHLIVMSQPISILGVIIIFPFRE